ncbi:hypothetical protein VRY54_03585 [Actinomyces sp. F1_1611]
MKFAKVLGNERRRTAELEKEDIIDDVVFEIELIKQVEINVDYILRLVRQHQEDRGQQHDQEFRADITRAIDSSPSLRNKKDLIERFVDTVSMADEIDAQWQQYVSRQREEELAGIIAEEKLDPERTRRLVEESFRDGELRTTGTQISDLLPPVSRFAKGNPRLKLKQRVIERLSEFVERFKGLGSSGAPKG